MDPELLADSPIGQLIPIQDSDARYGPYACFAYLPAPLPEEVGITMTTIRVVSEATGALTRLDQACAQLREPGLLIRPALYREALDTSALEGTYGQLSEVLEAGLPGAQFQSAETREILGYVQAALGAFESVLERPITIGLLAEAQGEMFRGADRQPPDLGQVRKRQVWIGPADMPITQARFVPVPGDDRLKSALDHWVDWVQKDNPWPVVLRAALAHYQFETLHPFSDGNGRIGRLTIVLQLLKAGIIQHPAITISPWFFKHRDEYQNQLLSVSCTGDWNPWVQFFCRAIIDQCGALISGADRLNQWLSDSMAIINKRRWAGAIYDVLRDLTQWPVVSIASVAVKCGVTPTAATNIVNHLAEVGIIEEMTGRSYGRMFGATEIMSIVDSI